MRVYSTVHTEPNTHAGGAHSGLISAAYELTVSIPTSDDVLPDDENEGDDDEED